MARIAFCGHSALYPNEYNVSSVRRLLRVLQPIFDRLSLLERRWNDGSRRRHPRDQINFNAARSSDRAQELSATAVAHV
jgi:hypothetical protein